MKSIFFFFLLFTINSWAGGKTERVVLFEFPCGNDTNELGATDLRCDKTQEKINKPVVYFFAFKSCSKAEEKVLLKGLVVQHQYIYKRTNERLEFDTAQECMDAAEEFQLEMEQNLQSLHSSDSPQLEIFKILGIKTLVRIDI